MNVAVNSKRIVPVLLITFSLLLTNFACQNDTLNVESEVAYAVEAFNEGFENPTLEKVAKWVSEDLNYGHSSGLVQNKAEFLDDLVNGSFKFINPVIEDQEIEIHKNIAVVRHVFKSNFENNGTSGDLKIRILQIWINENNGWKLLARQAFKI